MTTVALPNLRNAKVPLLQLLLGLAIFGVVGHLGAALALNPAINHSIKIFKDHE